MRRTLALVALLAAVAGCGGPPPDRDYQQEPGASNAVATADVSETAEQRAGAGPNVSLTAAPGVAFHYRYAFRLPAERIAEVQERHAAACEALGTDRCRITGLHYEVRDERNIRGRLNLALEPSIARRYGREGVGAVVQADGSLVESEISGTDVGSGIRRSGRSIAENREELRRIEARLAGRLSADERERLEYEAQQLRAQIRAAQVDRQDAQESLATTPMTFTYGSGDFVPGPEGRQPLGSVLRDAGDNFLDGAVVLLAILLTLAPWALLALLLWLAARQLNRRYRQRAGATPETAQSPDPAAQPPFGAEGSG
jgi:hypothetical protein